MTKPEPTEDEKFIAGCIYLAIKAAQLLIGSLLIFLLVGILVAILR